MKKIAIVVSALLLLTGCSSSAEEATPTPSATASENPYGAGFAIDPPADEEITIVEPFVKVEQTFKVVKLEKLLKDLGFKPTDKLSTVALNDYAFADTVENFTKNNAYIAVSRDGGPIPMDQGGPIRIVFASDSGYFTNLDAWNWSIRTIEIAKP